MIAGIVRAMQHHDVGKAVDVHLRAFPGFFLTFLGAGFLRELYASILADQSGIGFVWDDGAGMSGFVCGSSQPQGLYTRLLKRRWHRFGWAALPGFLKEPGILPRLLRALRMPEQEASIPHCACLMSIAVHPEWQGQGAGKALVAAFVCEAEQRGCRAVNLTTDAVDNEATNRFYQRLGFDLLHTYCTPEGRAMNEYIKYLDECGEPA